MSNTTNTRQGINTRRPSEEVKKSPVATAQGSSDSSLLARRKPAGGVASIPASGGIAELPKGNSPNGANLTPRGQTAGGNRSPTLTTSPRQPLGSGHKSFSAARDDDSNSSMNSSINTAVEPHAINPSIARPYDAACDDKVAVGSDANNVEDSVEDSEPRVSDELLERRHDLTAHLRSIELELRFFASIVAIAEKKSRAEDFRTRAAPLVERNKAMRQEIQLLRNADRVLVSLREQQDAVEKHLRLRKAQIRQKEATIDIISKRFTEQGEGSKALLDGINKEITALESLCTAMEGISPLANRVNPILTLCEIVKLDSTREELHDSVVSFYRSLSAKEMEAAAELSEVRSTTEKRRQELSQHIARCQDKDSAEAKEIRHAIDAQRQRWLVEKERLLLEKSKAQRALRDTLYHVRRGTNVKSTSQMPGSINATFCYEEVRELRLALGELQTSCDAEMDMVKSLGERLNVMAASFADDVGAKQREVEALRRTRHALAAEVNENAKYAAVLQCRAEGREPQPEEIETLRHVLQCHDGVQPLNDEGEETLVPFTLDHSGEGSAAMSYSPSRDIMGEGVGKGFLSQEAVRLLHRKREHVMEAVRLKRPATVMERLMAPTRSYCSFLTTQEEEASERAVRRQRFTEQRPAGCRPQRTKHTDSSPAVVKGPTFLGH